MVGKLRRLSRLFTGEKHRCLLSPLDHGGWLGPVKGLNRPRQIVEQVISGGANALLISPGFYRAVAPVVPSHTAIVLRVSMTAGLSEKGTQETPVATLETALAMDADAVAVSVFFGRDGDIEIYKWLGGLIDACRAFEMPVVAEMMPPEVRSFDATAIAHAARIGMEIGADVIKTNYCGDREAFGEMVQSVPLPIIIAGGPSTGNVTTVELVQDAIAAGAAGVAIGRRVWQSDDPAVATRQIADILWK
ncbi:MAG: fructose-bisphosphate aldolase [Anaerolineaceae bacterium]|nr:fructose-bisphosphate aldolase [Anaerolineaceae bacterium]